jgi:hypothetical protein
LDVKGLLYIAGAVKTIKPARDNSEWLPNDPHFWSNPPTWGICRNDLRRKTDVGDYVFFVLGKGKFLPQMVFDMMVSLACIVFYLRERRDEFNVLLHIVFPVLAILILFAPLYYQFAPLPDYPVRLGNYFAILWIVLGFVALGLAASQRPQAIAQAEEIFVEDETVAPGAGPATRST